MSERPSYHDVVQPLGVVAVLAAVIFLPLPPWPKLGAVALSLLAARAVARWYVRTGYDRVGADANDCWLFVVLAPLAYFVSLLLAPSPLLSPARAVVHVVASAVVAGGVAVTDRRALLRRVRAWGDA